MPTARFSQTLAVYLTRRMHRLRDKGRGAAMIQLPLNPVMLFLFCEPGLRKWRAPERASATLQQQDHCQGVIALLGLDAQQWPNPGEERPCLQTSRCPPSPGLTGPGGGAVNNDPTAPEALHPVEHVPISIDDNHVNAVLISTFRR